VSQGGRRGREPKRARVRNVGAELHRLGGARGTKLFSEEGGFRGIASWADPQKKKGTVTGHRLDLRGKTFFQRAVKGRVKISRHQKSLNLISKIRAANGVFVMREPFKRRETVKGENRLTRDLTKTEQ